MWGEHVLRNLGDPKPGSETLKKRRHRVRFEPDTNLLLGGEIDVTFASGEEKLVTFERAGNQIAFLRCGMYGGPNGGTPDGDIWHGQYVGDMVISGETIEVTDPGTQWDLSGLDDVVARFECDGEVTFGITETETAVLLEGAQRGIRGLSLLPD
jgi:hypothetical protein